tara:strand:- start:60 stop:251 length:192 start_codon:yes stop_codon:yes gene_type:complete
MVEELNHDAEQNRRIRDVESRMNTLENQVSMLLGRLETMTSMMKVLAVGVGAMVGLDLQGMVV